VSTTNGDSLGLQSPKAEQLAVLVVDAV